MKRAMPFDDQVDISSDESSSDKDDVELARKQSVDDIPLDQATNEIITEETVVRRSAQMYQDFMMQLPIPKERGSRIPFNSWTGFGKSSKLLYKQPLHYLTNVRLKQLDQNRCGADGVEVQLDTIMHPAKAEAFLWMMEEAHRLTTSHHHLAILWLNDPTYRAFVDPYVPPS